VDVGSIRVHREDGALGLILIEIANIDDLTVGGSSTTARVLLVFLASLTIRGSSATTRALLVLFATSTTATQRPDNADEEEQYYDGPQTPREDRVSAPPAPLRCLLLRSLLVRWFPWGTSTRLRWRRDGSIRLRRRYVRL
jgi:hypothetical protein